MVCFSCKPVGGPRENSNVCYQSDDKNRTGGLEAYNSGWGGLIMEQDVTKKWPPER